MTEPLRVSRDQAVELNVVHRLIGSPDGQTFLRWLEQRFCRRRSFVEGDPHATSFREGQRDVVEQIRDAYELSQQDLMVDEPEAEMV